MTAADDQGEHGEPRALPRSSGRDVAADDSEVVDAHLVEEAAERALERFAVSYQWQGPLPPPQALRAFEDVLPGAAERILAMTEAQVAHRHDMETRVVTSGVQLERRGQLIAGFLGAVAIIGGILLVAFDKDVAGFATVLVAVAGLVGTSVWSRISQNREADARAAELEPPAPQAPDEPTQP